jgi:hypothetical protein
MALRAAQKSQEIKHLCLPPTIRRNSLPRGNERLFMHIVKHLNVQLETNDLCDGKN